MTPPPDPVESVVELSVNMTCGKCVTKVKASLEGQPGISEVQVDLRAQRVQVTSTKPAFELKDLIETTGKTAVISGLGTLGSAVAMIGKDGQYNNGGVLGVVRFTQVDQDRCVIEGTVDGLTPGEHGLAVHEAGDLSQGCDRLGEHYNPRGRRHGSPDNEERHVGDLGNITAGQDGRATFRITDKQLKVWDVIGRSLVVAEGRDDQGLGGAVLSLVTGNCGPAAACGIIARSAGVGQNDKKICACDGVTIWDERDKPLVGPGRRQ